MPNLFSLINRLVQQARQFADAERGVVAVIVALAAIPMLIAGGLAIDLSRAYLVKSRLSHALDAAGLAVGTMRTTSSDPAYLESQFNSFFTANYAASEIGTTSNLTFTDVGGVLTVTGQSTVNTVFMSIVGIDTITVASSAEITVETNGLELVMVLDNTGSMGMPISKMNAMKSAAQDLIDILFGDETTPDLLKVGLVPFDNTVNIGTGNVAYINQTAGTFTNWASLLKVPAPLHAERQFATSHSFKSSKLAKLYSLSQSYPASGSAGLLQMASLSTLSLPKMLNEPSLRQNVWGGSTWEGCVMARTYPADILDSDIVTDGKWEPFYNIKSSDKNKHCPRPITPLTNNRATLEAEITAMSPLGSTHINFGAVWGWRVLSPSAPFTEGAAYSDPDWNKAAIILTDGDNTMIDSYYSAYGLLAEANLGTSSQSSAENELDDRLGEVCTGMKNAGIIVYTIAFGTSISGSTQTMLTNCATSADNYYESPDSATLTLAFRAIGAELKNLHLSK
ncbi:pilus assembly protein [Magnetovibrio blakemorei]|uniref:Putative Flp pilus-assembly TadG-like N-terminal domain-containing protein n=1 Tax=Magnetovibrio blakemorei TaxID=28181 RepID=A0A1E5QAN5_9PROT|nr:pilus assembly protein [Magnetovibrio blakemorei]OEJ68918.1 hypothetical protein BEN30_05265 [Magnetovibrio blakemorei]